MPTLEQIVHLIKSITVSTSTLTNNQTGQRESVLVICPGNYLLFDAKIVEGFIKTKDYAH